MSTQIKIAFFDIDGTLATNSIQSNNIMDRVSDSTRDAIKRLKENGIIPIIATGRGKAVIQTLTDGLGIDSCITANGSHLVFQGKELFNQYMESDIIKQTVKQFSEFEEIAILFETSVGYISYKKEINMEMDMNVLVEHEIDNLSNYNIYELLLIGRGLRERVIITNPDLKARMVAPIAMNIFPKDVSKAIGIERLLNHLNLESSEAIAFGDEENDIEMFQAVGFSVAMGNGVEELKRIASYVTDDVDHDGIYNACKYYDLI